MADVQALEAAWRAGRLRALSLTQPWPWIILHLGKRIENRTRNIGNHRGPLLLHATARMTADDWWWAYDYTRRFVGPDEANRIPCPFPDYDVAKDRGLHAPRQRVEHPDLPQGVIFARTEVLDQFALGWPLPLLPIDDDLRVQRQRWYMGEHAWLFGNVVPTRLVPWKGALGFWNVPERLLQQVVAP